MPTNEFYQYDVNLTTACDYMATDLHLIVVIDDNDSVVCEYSQREETTNASIIANRISATVWRPLEPYDYLFGGAFIENPSTMAEIAYIKNICATLKNSSFSTEIEQIYIGLCKDSLKDLVNLIESLQPTFKKSKEKVSIAIPTSKS